MINCKNCSHYHHQNDQIFCDAGIMDIRIIGKVFIGKIEQETCIYASITEATQPEAPAPEQKRIGRPPKHGK